jgi:diacylglycerol kinase family enzyme
MVLDRERRRSLEGHSRWAAMTLAFLRMLRHFPRRHLAVHSEGWTQPYRTPCLFIGNNQYSTDLFALGKRDKLDRGELWLYIVKQRRPLAFLWPALRTALGLLDQARISKRSRSAPPRSAAARAGYPSRWTAKVETMRPPLRYRARPGALRVLTPALVET